jgi:NAD(P)-dependent dehydrogenase (short-subunit alcohol dehydrogenase family)
VTNAAVSTHVGDFFDISPEQYQKMWDVNYTSTFLLVKEALPYLQKQPGSAIIITSSESAYKPTPLIGHYALTKTALLGLTKTLA